MKSLPVPSNSDEQVRVSSEFAERVGVLIDAHGSASALAKKAGISEGVVRKWKKGESEPTLSNLLALAEAGGVNVLWLSTGEGPRERTAPPPELPADTVRRIVKLYHEFPGKVASVSLNRMRFVQFWNNRGDGRRVPDSAELPPDLVALLPAIGADQLARWEKAVMDYRRFEKEEASRQAFSDKHGLTDAPSPGYSPAPSALEDDFVLVPQYDAEVSAGHGSFVDQDFVLCRMAFRRDWIREMGLTAGSLALVTVKGDSMEPTLLQGDLALVDASVKGIRDDGIYVLRRDGTLVIKRLQMSLGGDLYVRSDNPRYREENIPVERLAQVNVLGKVVWMGRSV